MYSKTPCGNQVKTAAMDAHINKCMTCRFMVSIDQMNLKAAETLKQATK